MRQLKKNWERQKRRRQKNAKKKKIIEPTIARFPAGSNLLWRERRQNVKKLKKKQIKTKDKIKSQRKWIKKNKKFQVEKEVRWLL